MKARVQVVDEVEEEVPLVVVEEVDVVEGSLDEAAAVDLEVSYLIRMFTYTRLILTFFMILFFQVGGRQEALVEVEADPLVGLEEGVVAGSVAVEVGGDKPHHVCTHDSISVLGILLCTEQIKGIVIGNNVNIIYHVHIYSSVTVIYIFVNKQIICIIILLIISL